MQYDWMNGRTLSFDPINHELDKPSRLSVYSLTRKHVPLTPEQHNQYVQKKIPINPKMVGEHERRKQQ